MLQALPRLSRAAVRVRRIGIQVTAMALNHQSTSPSRDKGGTVTAAILIIGDEILKVIADQLNSSYLVQVVSQPLPVGSTLLIHNSKFRDVHQVH